VRRVVVRLARPPAEVSLRRVQEQRRVQELGSQQVQGLLLVQELLQVQGLLQGLELLLLVQELGPAPWLLVFGRKTALG
jgi:hypothetical protein